jgi:sugar phosphate isomerase/epimerase
MRRSNELTRRAFLARGAAIGAAGLALPQAVARFGGAAAEPSAQPGRWQIGCYTRPWAEYEYRVALDCIAAAGYKHVGLMTTKSTTGLVISTATTAEEARQIGQEARQRGLATASVYGGDFPVHQSLQAGIDGLRRLIDNCAAARAATLMVGGSGDEKLYQRYYKAIAECCDYAAEKKVGLVLKPHGGLNATGGQCRKCVELVAHNNFTLWYDPGNIYYYSDGKLDPVQDARTVDGLVTGMCVKDFAMSVVGGKISKDVMLTPGTGKVDFPGVMAVLRKGGLSGGPLIVETLAPGDRKTILAEARKARVFVERLMARQA